MRNDSATTVWGRAIWAGVLALILMGAAVGSEGQIIVFFESLRFDHSQSHSAKITARIDVEDVAPQICTGLHIRWQSLTIHDVCNTISEDDVDFERSLTTPFTRIVDVQIPKKLDRLRLQISPRFESDKTKYASDFLNFTLTHGREDLIYLIGSVMLSMVIILGSIAWYFRGQFRIHLSTCLITLISLGILLFINDRDSYVYRLAPYRVRPSLVEIFGSPGWPMPLSGTNFIGRTPINSTSLAIDTSVFVGVLIGVAVVSEYLIRRKTKSVMR